MSSPSKSATYDITPSEEDAEEIAFVMARAFGVKPDRCREVVDQYGWFAQFAFEKVQDKIASGYQARSGLAIMHTMLRSGEAQVEALRAWQEEDAIDDEVEHLRKRWEHEQSNPNIFTAQKRLGEGISLAVLEERTVTKRGLVSLDCGHFVTPIEGTTCRCGQIYVTPVTKTEETVTVAGQKRYASNAERQKAYRERNK
mgnify:CR=1 FL=1